MRQQILEVLISSSVLILALALLRILLRGKISPRLQFGLWLLVAVRRAERCERDELCAAAADV